MWRSVRSTDWLREPPESREVALQERLGVLKAHPLFDHRRIDAAEVRRHDQIAVVVQLLEARVLAVQPAFDWRADDGHWRGRAMVGAPTLILGHAAAEFGKDHHRDLRGASEACEVLEEAFERVRHIH